MVGWTQGPRKGLIDSFDDLWSAEFEWAPRPDFRLIVSRSEGQLEIPILPGRWEVTSAPGLTNEATAAFEAWLAATRIVTATTNGTLDNPATRPDWDLPIRLAREQTDRVMEAWLYVQRASWLGSLGDLPGVRSDCQRAVELFVEHDMPLAAAQSAYTLARLIGRGGSPAEEESIYRGVIDQILAETPDNLHLVPAWSGLAKAKASRGDYEAAVRLGERALELAEQRAPRSLEHQASLMILGIFHWFRSDWRTAETYLRGSLEILQEIDPDHEDVANALNNLGIVAAARGDLIAAESYYERSLETRRRVAPDALQESRTINNLGTIARRRGDLATESTLNRQVLELRRRLTPDSLDLATPLLNEGELLVQLGEWAEADQFLREALDLQQRHAAGSVDEAMGVLALAQLEAARGNDDQAEVLYQTAESLVQENWPNSLVAARTTSEASRFRFENGSAVGVLQPLETAVLDLHRFVPGTLELALALQTLGRVQQASGNQEGALRSFESATEAMDRQFLRLGGDPEQRAGFRQSWRHIYRDLADLYREFGRDEEAFEVLERGRSQAFLQFLQRRDVDLSRGPAEATWQELATVRDRWIDLQEALTSIGDQRGDRALDSLMAERAELESILDELATQLAQDDPRWRGLSASRSVADIQSALRDHATALVAYVSSESSLHAWVLDGHQLTRHELALSGEALADRVERYRLLVERPPPVPVRGTTPDLVLELANALWAPLRPRIEGFERVVVVADGPLHHLPFAALIRAEDQPGTNPALQFPASASAWLELSERLPTRSKAVVVLADPPLSNAGRSVTRSFVDPLRPLPASRTEARQLQTLFPESIVHIGRAASELQARQVDSATDILHFATHAFVDPNSPLDSSLLLASSEADGVHHDGLLQAWEVLQEMNLESSLVTLSACSSGTGALYLDEGILGLTRSFQLAGAQSVLASLWPVADEATSQLMGHFYRQIREGQPYDRALSRAQELMSRQPETAHPFYWAGFQLYGFTP